MADISKLSPDGGTTEYDLKDSTARANIGDLSELETTDKSDLVSAINEVAQGGGGGGSVTGVKGDSETTYRTGNVNITKANIGLDKVENKTVVEILKSGYITTGRKSGSTYGGSSTIEGVSNISSGTVSHSEGQECIASGTQSHAEGYKSEANGDYSHAEGSFTKANGINSHAEGNSSTASAYYSHAEGASTTASGNYSHAEGNGTVASGQYSHAEGAHTTAAYAYQHVGGIHNNNKSTTFFEIGNGNNLTPVNIFEVYNDGSISQDDGSTKFRFTQSNGVDGYYDASGTFHPFGGGSSGSVTGVKGSAETNYRTGDVSLSPTDIGLGNVENKSSSTIRSEITSSDVTTALGYTPPQQDTTYNVVSKTENGLVPQLPNETATTKFLRQDGTWAEPSGGGGGSSTYAGLSDVSLSSLTDGDISIYDSSQQKWVNSDALTELIATVGEVNDAFNALFDGTSSV